MRGAIPPLPQYAFMAWCLVKHRDTFTFTTEERGKLTVSFYYFNYTLFVVLIFTIVDMRQEDKKFPK
jgi:hypothetical protein